MFTLSEKVEMLQRMMEDDDTGTDVLRAYLILAGQKILNRMYPFGTECNHMHVPDKYVSVQLNVACYLLNKRGAEGEIQHIENGIHRNYGSSDVPDGMLKDVIPYCKAIR